MLSLETLERVQSRSVVHALEKVWGCSLSQRELEVGRLVIEGLSTLQIAQTLFISENTVKTHLRNLFRKTKTRSRAELYRQLVDSQILSSRAGVPAPHVEETPHVGQPKDDRQQAECVNFSADSPTAVVLMIKVAWEPQSPAAESLLPVLPDLLATSVRQVDQVCHWRKDTFLLGLTSSDLTCALEVGDRLVRKVRRWALLKGIELQAWVGAAGPADEAASLSDLARIAEQRLRPVMA